MADKINDITQAKFHNKQIRITGIVIGKGQSPYLIPKLVKINLNGKKSVEYEIEAKNQDILKFIDVSDSRIQIVLGELLGDDSTQYEIIEMQNIERIFFQPPTGKERNRLGVTHVGYYIGHGLEINTSYDFEGYTTTDPRSQIVTHVFTSATKVNSDIESFNITSKNKSLLEEFSAGDETESSKLLEKLEALYKTYAYNVTKIYGRFDLHLAIDLAFRSVIKFRFDNRAMSKGWSDIMIIGDTRCGKNGVTESLVKYFGVGEVVSGDNVTFAGLVGGIQQLDKNWVVTWGRIPLNDCGLLVIDEAGELKDTDWSRLSRIRSEGIAEITKIMTSVTNARTRLIFLANPPNKTIANYSYGIQSLIDIIRTPEDIARFDYVLIVAHSEVDMEEINQPREMVTGIYPASLERELILWTWSRRLDDIVFSDEATKLIFKSATRLSRIYSFTIPLIQGENVRIKIAKIAIAFAARFFSNRKEGKILYVDKVHVECALQFFKDIYKKPVSGYYDMSQLQPSIGVDRDIDLNRVEKYFNAYRNKQELCKCLLYNNYITNDIISDHLNQPKEIAKEIISTLIQSKCIESAKSKSTYHKTAAFTAWLKKTLTDPIQ